MPNQPKTKTKSIRIDAALWDAALRVSQERGETVTDVLRNSLERYVKRYAGTQVRTRRVSDGGL